MQAKANLVVEQAPAGPAVVMAHSLGANVVALALRNRGLYASRLIFAEPALYDIARGDTVIEACIAPMEQARAKAAAGDLFGYWQIVKPIMFGGPAVAEEWSEEEAFATEFSAHAEPWGAGHSPRLHRGNSDARRHRWVERRVRGHRRCVGGPWGEQNRAHRVSPPGTGPPTVQRGCARLREVCVSTGSPCLDDSLMPEALRCSFYAD